MSNRFRRTTGEKTTHGGRDSDRDDRAQIVLVAAAVVAVALLSMTLAYAQLGYDADRSGAGTVDVASLPEIRSSLTASFRVASADLGDGVGTHAPALGDSTGAKPRRGYSWAERRDAVGQLRSAVQADIDRLEHAHATQSRSLTVTFDDPAATQWASEYCPSGRGRAFGPCRTVDGVVVQARAGRTTVVAAAVRIRIVSPAESTTAVVVLRAV